MHCWFCESALSPGPAGPYCPFADCPACKTDPGPLHGVEPERWRRMRKADVLAANLQAAGLPQKGTFSSEMDG